MSGVGGGRTSGRGEIGRVCMQHNSHNVVLQLDQFCVYEPFNLRDRLYSLIFYLRFHVVPFNIFALLIILILHYVYVCLFVCLCACVCMCRMIQ